jgi:ATP-dependent DNA helicase RecG
MIRADSELRYLKGVGPRRAEALSAQGLHTVEDLLYLLPFRYEDRRSFAHLADLRLGEAECTLSVTIDSARLIRTRRRGFTIFEAVVSDSSGNAKVLWYNQPYLTRVIKPGRKAVLYGRLTANRYGELVLENPEFEFIEDEDAAGIHTGRVVPVYRKTAELSSRVLRQVLHRALTDLDPRSLPALVPPAVAGRHQLLDRGDALREVHFPPQSASIGDLHERRTAAQRSLAFEEIFLLQLALALRRHGFRQQSRGIAYEVPDALRTKLARILPFKLTQAQKRVLREIGADLRSDHPMNRLLQGDVGSGKTIVALLTLLVAVENGYQGVLMAPTEILVEQHYRNVIRFLEGGAIDCSTALLTGSLRVAARRRALEAIGNGEARLVVGTHALFEAGVEFDRLGLAVIDEQHRFGVLQRAALAAKGERPDVLVMTATPIPRSLALTLYGDLDLSLIDEMPPGRTPVRTVVREEASRAKVYEGLQAELRRGRQAYVVVPLVEETARSDLKAAEEFARQLREETLSKFNVGMVHGRMKSAEKEETMHGFVTGAVDVLVATTVIEVGVDVANATVMIVEHAERFGLSQLHQLRGRVGRGADQSYCVLMVGGEHHGREARERLAVMERTSDGFKIAEKDLQLRGPGAVFGTQQHGLSDLQFLAEALRSPGLLDGARREARALVDGGAASLAEAQRILDALPEPWKRRLNLGQVG